LHRNGSVKHALIVKYWRCRLPLNFFGLNDEYIESVYEEIFQLKYHGGWSFIEAYSLPVQIRRWFLKRLQKQFEKENDQIEKAQRKNK
tara:strand:- start:231 stop:494 length:264 start_codon:yes stop_codon:yes gene_type:complete